MTLEATYKISEANFQSTRFNANEIPGVEIIEKEIYNTLSDSKGVIREMCSHILGAGGKRIRPLLVLYSGLIFSGPTGELLKAAVAAELIHMASLVHDDIIDNSSMRRNKPSMNKIWGNHFAVLCGDYLFAKAFGVLSNNRLLKSMDFMVESIQDMCHGEILQAGDRFNPGISIEAYYDRIVKKTAVFLQNCCKSGAAVAGADEIQVQLLGEYGLNLGLAFQIVDDILDYSGSIDIMGKPKGEDLSQGDITLPLIILTANEKYGKAVKKAICEKELKGNTLIQIEMWLKESGTVEKAFDIAASHIEKAKGYLKLLPQSRYVEFLDNLADMLKTRMN